MFGIYLINLVVMVKCYVPVRTQIARLQNCIPALEAVSIGCQHAENLAMVHAHTAVQAYYSVHSSTSRLLDGQ